MADSDKGNIKGCRVRGSCSEREKDVFVNRRTAVFVTLARTKLLFVFVPGGTFTF